MIKGYNIQRIDNKKISDKTVIVLPGTRWQIPIICKLKQRGYRVVVFDLYEGQPAYEYSDEHRIVDILDRETVLKLANEYNPVAVVSEECDIAVPTVAWVSEQLGKPTIGTKMAELYTNKFRMREHALKYKFPVPLYYKCSSIEGALMHFRQYGKKMIIKPLNANSSRGVFSIYSEQDIIDHFEDSIKYSKGEKSVLLEEYIQGEEFSVDGLVIGEDYYTFEVAHKLHYENNENLDKSLLFTYSNPDYDYDKLRETNEKYVKSTGIEFAITHAEYKYCNGEFYLIEIGARGGGNLLSSVIDPNISGIDVQSIYLDWACGVLDKTVKYEYAPNYKSRCACLVFFDVDDKQGIVDHIDGISILESDDRILAFDFFYKIGDRIEKAHDATSRFGYYIACCNSLSELDELQERISECVVPCIRKC